MSDSYDVIFAADKIAKVQEPAPLPPSRLARACCREYHVRLKAENRE